MISVNYGFGPPPSPRHLSNDAAARPKKLREWPRYIFDSAKGFFSHLFYIIGLVWETKKSILFWMIFFCIASGFLPVFHAYITKELINEIVVAINKSTAVSTETGMSFAELFTSGDYFGVIFGSVAFLMALQFVYLIVNRVVNRVSAMVNNIAGELVSNHIKLKIMDKAKKVDLSSFDRPDFYEKLENANREAGMRPLMILRATFNIISTAITLAGFVGILLTLHPIAPLVIVLLAAPGAIINYKYRNKNFRYMRRSSKERRQMNYFSGVVTNKDVAKELRVMALSDTFIGRYKTAFAKYFAGIRSLLVKEEVVTLVVGIFSIIGNTLIFLYIAYKVISDGNVEQIGNYSYYSSALNSISSNVSSIITSTATIYEGTLFIDNMIQFLAEKETIVPTVDEPRIPEKHTHHTIELRNVSFRYPGAKSDTLKNINLKLESGRRTVLVGLNGAGKTTLIKLITRLYDPSEGVILLDGHDIREYDVAALYDLYGMIFQDFGKYAVSVGENIAFGDISLPRDREREMWAAKMSNSSDFIERLPSKYDTELMRYFEEDGTELSIGQWQKLSVARAFYKDSDILILDEPTASLDAIAEAEIYGQFSELGRGKITIFVSHRLSSAAAADEIVVIDCGRVVEIGNHATLMEQKGIYHKLFTTQAQRYIESGSDADEVRPPRSRRRRRSDGEDFEI